MGNNVYIQRTEFTNVATIREEPSYGYRIYDDYDQTYCNTMAGADMQLEPSEFLAIAIHTFDERATSMFDFACHDKGAIYIDDERYTLTDDGHGNWKLSKSE